jgi:hypothetical protein
VPTSHVRCTHLYLQFKPFNFSLSNLAMGPLDPPPNFLATHLVPQVAPCLVSSAPGWFIHDNGTAFLRQYLVHPVSSPVTAPSPLMGLGGVSHEQWSIPLAGHSLHASLFCGLGSTSCVPLERALCTPVHHNTISAGPSHLDHEEDISGSHLCHGVQLATLHPPVVDGGHVGSLSALSLDRSYVPSSGCSFGGSLDPEEDILWGRLPHGIWLATSHPPFVYGGRFGLRCHCPLVAPLFRHLGLLIGGLLSPPLLLVCIVGDLHSPPLLLGLWLWGPWGLHIGRLVWGAPLLWSFLRLSLVRSRVFHHWWHLL